MKLQAVIHARKLVKLLLNGSLTAAEAEKPLTKLLGDLERTEFILLKKSKLLNERFVGSPRSAFLSEDEVARRAEKRVKYDKLLKKATKREEKKKMNNQQKGATA